MIYGSSPTLCENAATRPGALATGAHICCDQADGDHRPRQAASPRISARESSNLVQFRPARLASYRHQSARSIKARGRSPLRNSEMPIEIVIVPRRFLLDRIVSSRPTILLRICSARTVALLSLVFGRMTANSSPPYRAAVSWPFIDCFSVAPYPQDCEPVAVSAGRGKSSTRYTRVIPPQRGE
jgi:hypothetical protein